MGVATETAETATVRERHESVVGWAAVAASTTAVLAWAACCVLPMTLALAGTGMAATARLAGQRSWLTAVAALILGAGWVLTWRRARACRADPSCRPASRLTLSLLSGASVLLLAAVAWPGFIEPVLLRFILTARG